MKTLIYGSGPVGRYYTSLLQRASKDVTLLARGYTYQNLQEQGIVLVDGFTGRKETVPIKVTDKFDPEENYDLVVVPMQKSSRLAVCPDLGQYEQIPNILFIGNDVSIFYQYFEFLTKEKVLLGFPGVGGGIENNALIYADRSKPKGPRNPLYIGEIDGIARERTHRIKALFESAGVPVSIEKDIDGWLKYHFAFIAPIVGIYFKCNKDFESIKADADAIRTYLRATREAGNVLRAAGYWRRQPFMFNLYYWLPEWLNIQIFRDKFFGSRFVEIGMGMHANSIGPELGELVEEFRLIQKVTAIETPYLDELLSYIPQSSIVANT